MIVTNGMKKIILILAVGVTAFVGYFFYTYKSFNLPSKATVDTGGAETKPLPFELQPGFKMSVFAKDVKNARVMVMSPGGVMFVSQPSEGKISALPDKDGNGVADENIAVVGGLNKPHGLAFRCLDIENPLNCKLYVGETNQLSEFDYDSKSMLATNKKKILDLPSDGYNQHFTRTLLFMLSPNENTLLISVGSSCNVCQEKDERRAKILSYDFVSKKSGIFSRGLRNSVFMEIHPVTGAIWATEMGRDGLGDDIPPDEINIIEKGKNYGWPICYGENIHDGEFDKNTYIRNPCDEPFETPSHIDLQAHSSPLGLTFVPEEGWTEEYRHDLLVAYHGSWNRSVPTGYKIVRFNLDINGKYNKGIVAQDFITGWLASDGTRIGRPVDIKAFPGGNIYISDDQAGIIYRITNEYQ